MIRLLSFFMLKEGLDEGETRGAMGKICGTAGIILNILLFMGKFFAGLISGSIAVTADAFNNLSDAGSSIITLLGFKIAGQKPDAQHPYGHGRMEYIAGFVVSALILAMSFSLIKDSAAKIISPSPVDFSWLVMAILIISILVKFYMAYYNITVGRRINSPAIKAAATDSLSDCLSTAVVLASTLIVHFTGLQIDGICGLLVGLLIAYAGITAARDTLNPLLGQPPEPELVDAIADITVNFDSHIIGMHDLLVHDNGPGRKFISLHAEVPADENVLVLHDIIDNLERKLQQELHCMATVHMDPVVTDDPRVAELREKTLACVRSMDHRFTIHDFRVVFGDSHTNLLFDVLIPMSCSTPETEIKKEIQDNVWRDVGENYMIVVDIDRSYNPE